MYFCKSNKFVRMPISSWPLPFLPSSRPSVSSSRVLCDLFLAVVSPFRWCALALSVFAWIWIYHRRWRRVFSNRVNRAVAVHLLLRRAEERLAYTVLNRVPVAIGKPMKWRNSFQFWTRQLTGIFSLFTWSFDHSCTGPFCHWWGALRSLEKLVLDPDKSNVRLGE